MLGFLVLYSMYFWFSVLCVYMSLCHHSLIHVWGFYVIKGEWGYTFTSQSAHAFCEGICRWGPTCVHLSGEWEHLLGSIASSMEPYAYKDPSLYYDILNGHSHSTDITAEREMWSEPWREMWSPFHLPACSPSDIYFAKYAHWLLQIACLSF